MINKQEIKLNREIPNELLSDKQTLFLIKKAQKGDKEALRNLVLYNLRLVLFVINRYYYEITSPALDIEDLVSEGTIGIIKSVKKYDPTRNCKFSTYAVKVIKNEIDHAIFRQGNNIKIPENTYKALFEIKRAEMKLLETLNRSPYDEEIANYLGIEVEQISIIRKATNLFISIDEPMAKDDSNSDTLASILKYDELSIEEKHSKKELCEIIKKIINDKLSEKDAKIIKKYFYDEKVLREIGKEMGISYQTVKNRIDKSLDIIEEQVCDQFDKEMIKTMVK